MNTSWSAFTSNTITAQSVEFDLTPTIRQATYLQNSNSLLSLSNYLQHEDQPTINNINNQGGQIMIKKSHLITQNNPNLKSTSDNHFYEEESESMLLLDSAIKQDKFAIESNCRLVESQQMLTQEIFQLNSDVNETKQSLFSKIENKESSKNQFYCTDSFELMELLSIPKQSETSRFRQLISSTTSSNEDETSKLKNLLKMLCLEKSQYQKFFNNNKIHPSLCEKCISYEKRIKNLQQYIDSKEKEILKFEELIEKLNEKIFDMKVQNKRLTFENQKYFQQLSQYLSKNTRIQSNKIPKTKNQFNSTYDFFDEDFQELPKGNVFTESSLCTKNSIIHTFKSHLKKFDEQSQKHSDYQSPIKAYPQTPLPVTTYVKPKKQRKPSNFSDHSLQISISKVKEPSLYQIAEMKIEKVLKDNNINFIDPKKNQKIQSQNNIMRFSNLSKQGFNEICDLTQYESYQAQKSQVMRKNLSPLKRHNFNKVKAKQSLSGSNIKAHPKNKHSYQQDNCSQTSETKTEKIFYMVKKSSNQNKMILQNDINSFNKKSHEKGTENSLNLVNRLKTNSDNKIVEKNSIIYKSFKEIGSFNNENSQNQLKNTNTKKEVKNFNSNQCLKQYGFHSNIINVEKKIDLDGKPHRMSFSPTPHLITMKRQNTSRSNQTRSPHKNQITQKASIKPFFR